MDRTEALALLTRYYAAFNAGDWEGMLDCLDDGVIHDINQGGRQRGKDAFRSFLAHMERCYRERLDGIVLMARRLSRLPARSWCVAWAIWSSASRTRSA